MKKIKWLGFFIVCFLSTAYLMAANEIDIDTDTSNTSAPATPNTAVNTPIPDIAVNAPAVVLTVTPVSERAQSEASMEPTEIPSPIPVAAHGVLKMKDVYKAGISYCKKQDFAKAIRYLNNSLKIHDPYTPKYYYAEANAMLGMIYQFHIIDKKLAYQYYREALRIDPKTATARKHIREVSDKEDSK